MRLIGRKSITFQLTLLFAAVSTTVLLLLGLLVGSLVERHFEELDMELLDSKLAHLRHILEKVHSARELEALPRLLEDALVEHHGSAVQIVKPGGQILYSTKGARFPPQLLAESGGQVLRPMRWVDAQNHPYRGMATEIETGIEAAAPLQVAVSTDMIHHEHFMHSFRLALWTVVGLAALLTGCLGWLAAHRGLAPLREIRRSAAGITANRLHQRLSADSLPLELAEVAQTLNDMLARLEDSFRRLSDFSSDIAHELRTPVSNLLTQTQVMLSKARTPEEYRDVLASNVEEFEHLSRMIADMLFLAKSDNDLIIPHRAPVDLAAEVAALMDFYGALAEEKNLTLSSSGSGLVSGDRLMLRRAISNLLSNALRHAPAGGRVAVHVDDTGDAVVKLTVENSGEAIPPEHLPRLFDRFYRVDASRHRSSEGTGLGLAITRSIVLAHGGDAVVRSAGGITTFELTIPA